MKKIFSFIVFCLIFLSGCYLEKENMNIPFEQVSNSFSENIIFLLEEINGLFDHPNYEVICDAFGDNESLKIDANIVYSGFVDNKDATSDIYTDFYFFDKISNNEFSFSGLVQKIQKPEMSFFRLSGFSIDMGKGNYKSDLWYLILDNLGDKWVKYKSQTDDKINKIVSDIKFIVNTFSSSSVFEDKGQVMYEGKNACKITVKDNVLRFLNSRESINIVSFEGLFIVNSEDDIVIQINNMDLIYNYGDIEKTIKLVGKIGKETGNLNLYIDDSSLEIYYELHRKNIKFDIIKLKNFEKEWSIEANISNKKNNIKDYDINGNITMLPKFFYGSNLENEMKINIKCFYENSSGENSDIVVNKPDNYVLLDQILGDEFSIKNFIY